MAQLSSLLGKRNELIDVQEQNLEQGRIYMFQPGQEYADFRCGFCWKPPATGVAVIEIWGASGSGGMMCCCGIGLPGNPGAYSRKCICVTTSQYVTGTIGLSCGNASALCFRGCSDPTGVCWFSTTTNGCMCAQGGRGGDNRCVSSASHSPYCCFVALGYCATNIGSAGCGIVCNRASGNWEPQAYGGDVNCPGGFSCLYVGDCNPHSICCHKFFVSTSPWKFSTQGSVAQVAMSCGGCNSQFAGGQYVGGLYSALSALSKSPTAGHPWFTTWDSSSPCGCYESSGCYAKVPTGVPGLSGMPCPGVRDHGMRGGYGAIRIRFIAS